MLISRTRGPAALSVALVAVSQCLRGLIATVFGRWSILFTFPTACTVCGKEGKWIWSVRDVNSQFIGGISQPYNKHGATHDHDLAAIDRTTADDWHDQD